MIPVIIYLGLVGWCGGAGLTFSTGASIVGQGRIALAVGAVGRCLGIPVSFLSPSMGDGLI